MRRDSTGNGLRSKLATDIIDRIDRQNVWIHRYGLFVAGNSFRCRRENDFIMLIQATMDIWMGMFTFISSMIRLKEMLYGE